MSNEQQKIKPRKQHVQPREIKLDTDFQLRAIPENKDVIDGIVQAIKARKKIEPILLWDNGNDLVLLDGRQRLTAFRRAHPKSNRGIEARVYKVTHREALEVAIEANTTAKQGLTSSERLQAAWTLVSHRDGARLSISRTAELTGAGTRSVSAMRKRLKEIQGARESIPSHWSQARQLGGDWTPKEELSNAERNAEIDELAKALRKSAQKWWRRDDDLIADALQAAFGRKLRDMCDYLYGEEFAGDDEDDYLKEYPQKEPAKPDF